MNIHKGDEVKLNISSNTIYIYQDIGTGIPEDPRVMLKPKSGGFPIAAELDTIILFKRKHLHCHICESTFNNNYNG